MSRSAIRAVDGELAGWHPVDLAARVMQETLERADIEPATIDEVVLGCAEPVGAQGADMARAAVLAAGWPDRVGGTVIERGETSGLTAVQLAAAVLRAGDADRVVVVGVSVASLVPPGAAAVNRVYGAPWGDAVTRRLAEQEGPLPAPRLAERGAVAAGISRAELDALAARSLQRRARAGTTAADAIGPVPAWSRGAATTSSGRMVTTDVIRTFERLADLPPAFDADGLLTAATFAPPADGAAVLVLDRGPGDGSIGQLVATARATGDPFDPTGGVRTAVDAALGRARYRLGHDLEPSDLTVEVVESDAATVGLVAAALGLDASAVNAHGGCLATGHAGAAEELRSVMDPLPRLADGGLLLTVGTGPIGSAVTIWRRHGGSTDRI